MSMIHAKKHLRIPMLASLTSHGQFGTSESESGYPSPSWPSIWCSGAMRLTQNLTQWPEQGPEEYTMNCSNKLTQLLRKSILMRRERIAALKRLALRGFPSIQSLELRGA